MSVVQTIRDQWAQLPGALQAAGRYVLDHPGHVVTGTMRAVAAQAGLPPASLVRLAQQLGYAGWPALKQALAADMGLGAADYGVRAQALRQRPGEGLVGELFAAQHANLDSAQRLGTASLQAACRLLLAARAVHVAAYRSCFGLATSFTHVCQMLRPGVHLLDGAGGALEIQLSAVAAEDVLLVASFAPYSREALLAVQTAQAAGARIVALTDSAASPLALAADVSLTFSTRSPSFFPSVVAAQALIEALLELLASEADEAGLTRLRSAEAALFASGAYVADKPPRRRARRSG